MKRVQRNPAHVITPKNGKYFTNLFEDTYASASSKWESIQTALSTNENESPLQQGNNHNESKHLDC